MPVCKKKRTTSPSAASTSESSSSVLLDQAGFHQYLHALAQGTVRTVIETVIIEE
jgi:hypothetical protein